MILDLDHWREIGNALAANRSRTALTAFGVFWAIFMLLVMLGAGNGLRNGVDRRFMGAATNSFFVWTQRTSKPYAGFQAGRNFEMNLEDVEYLRANIPEVAVVAPTCQLGGWRGGNNVTRGERSGGFSVMGETPEMRLIKPMRIAAGRYLSPLDMAERRKVAVLGPKPREQLFAPDEDPLGQEIFVNGVGFTVIGVTDVLEGGEGGDDDAQAIQVPLSTYLSAFAASSEIGWISVLAKPGVRASVAEEAVVQALKRRHDVAPDDPRGFGHWNAEQEFEKVQGVFGAIRLLTWIVGIGTLAAGAIGVSNVMLVIVRERTREIGVRRAIGATPSAITSQIVLEAVMLTLVAGYLGLVAGVAVMTGVAAALDKFGSQTQMFTNPEVSLVNAFQALGLLVAAGAAAGLIPARRAVAITPVQALRGDA